MLLELISAVRATKRTYPMQTKKVIEHIASIAWAMKGCRERAEQPRGGDAERWANRHNGALGEIISNCLPSGSGFDRGVQIDWDATDIVAEKFVFVADFHCMDEHGYYCGWASFRFTVTPSFVLGMEMNTEVITPCPDADMDSLDEYVSTILGEALEAQFEIPASFYADI